MDRLTLLQERKDIISLLNNSALQKLEVEELSAYDNHPADNASEEVDKAQAVRLRQLWHEQLFQIDAALTAIDEGVYGYCQQCGRQIERERLDVLPYTLVCAEHGQTRPVLERSQEEAVLQDIAHPLEQWRDVARYGTSSR